MTALLAGLAAVMLGPRIAHGSFSNDDWSYAVLAKYPGPGGAIPHPWRERSFSNEFPNV